MTLLSMAERFADIVSLERPTVLVGNSEPTEREIVAIATQAGEELMRRGEWSRLYKEATIAASQTTVSLPDDFHRLIAGGAIMQGSTSTQYFRGATSADQWRRLKKTTSTQPYFFIRNGIFEFFPDSTTDGATAAYISKEWIDLAAGGEGTEWASDTDTALFSEPLMIKCMVWRWRRNKGLEYSDQLAEFEADLVTELKADKGLT